MKTFMKIASVIIVYLAIVCFVLYIKGQLVW